MSLSTNVSVMLGQSHCLLHMSYSASVGFEVLSKVRHSTTRFPIHLGIFSGFFGLLNNIRPQIQEYPNLQERVNKIHKLSVCLISLNVIA